MVGEIYAQALKENRTKEEEKQTINIVNEIVKQIQNKK